MSLFTVRYVLTERTIQEIEIEADSQDEAKDLVDSYDFDNSTARHIKSLEWSLDREAANEVV